MIAQYTMPIRFDTGCFAPKGEVLASALLRVFQDAATAHADEAHVGFEDLIKDGLIWVVTKIKYELLGTIAPGEEVVLTTYPIPVGSLLYQRDFYIQGGEELLVKASSQWCVADFNTRKAVQTQVDFPGEYTAKRAFPKGIERIRPAGLQPAGSRIITEGDLDRNRHTNNCRYADVAQELIGGDFTHFTINFAHETRLGDELLLSSAPGKAAGHLATGELVFAVSAE